MAAWSVRLPSVSGLTGKVFSTAKTPRPVACLGGGNGSGAGGNGKGNGGNGSNNNGSGSSGPRRSGMGMALGLSLAAQALFGVSSADAGKEPVVKKKEELNVDNVTDMLWNLMGPFLTNLGFSGCLGVAAGIALKKVGQMLAFAVGIIFLLMQALAYKGWVTVNWTKINDTVVAAFDANSDGKLDHNDFKHYVGKGLAVLAQGVPSAAGFLGGFVLAIKNF